MLSKHSNEGASNLLFTLENRKVTRSISPELRSAIANASFNFYREKNGEVGNVGDGYLSGNMHADLYTESVMEEASGADDMNMLMANNASQNGGGNVNRTANEDLLQSWLANGEVRLVHLRLDEVNSFRLSATCVTRSKHVAAKLCSGRHDRSVQKSH